MAMEENLTLGVSEHTMQYIYNVLLNIILETYLISLTSVTPILLI